MNFTVRSTAEWATSATLSEICINLRIHNILLLILGIDDYLLQHSLEEAQRLAGDFKIEEPQDKERSVSGFVLPDGTIGELVVGEDDERSFIIAVNGSVRKLKS